MTDVYFRKVVKALGTCSRCVSLGKVPKVRPTRSEGKAKLGSHLHAKTDIAEDGRRLSAGSDSPVQVARPSLPSVCSPRGRATMFILHHNCASAKEVEESYGFVL